jgi:LacI family transcriptional regulator
MNLKELSEHLGLSKTTVSRALNGFSDVSEDTRRRVEEAARRFDYTPNASAKQLATGRAGALGLVFPTGGSLLVDPALADFVAGLADGAARDGADLVVSSAPEGEELGYRRLARARAVDAIVLAQPKVEDLRVRLLSHLGLMTVVYGRTASSIPYAYLDIDNEGAFRRATEMLIGFGHRRIALINGDPDFTFAEHRLTGWVGGLAARGLPQDETLHISGALGEEAGYRGARRLLERPDAPTAFLCASMFAAAGCCRAIRDRGLAVGADVSVVAHDDGVAVLRPEAQMPALTTTFSSIRAAGVRIAELAAALIRGTDPANLQEVWPVDLIFRDSAQPARGR